MSSDSKVPEPLGDASYLLKFDPSPGSKKQTDEVTQSASLRFSSLTLDELSEELERRTKETQKLQEEVENATTEALKRFGCLYGNSSLGQSLCKNNSAEERPGCSAHQQPETQTVVFCPDTLKRDVVPRDRGSCEKEALENTLDNLLEQLSHLRLNEMHSEDRETLGAHRAIMNLQIKLHDAQIEKDFHSDMRLKDQMAKLLHLLEELQNVKRFSEQKLQETEDEASALRTEIESLETSAKRFYSTLYEKQFGHSSACKKNVKQQRPPKPASENLSRDTQDKQPWIFFSPEDQQKTAEYQRLNKQERMEDLITSLGQEVTKLTDKLSSSKHSGVNLCAKLRLLQHLAGSQTSLHHRQIIELESTLSSYRDKISYLQKKIFEIQAELSATQRERDHLLQQAEELHAELQQLKSYCERQQREHSEATDVLRRDLESFRKQLCEAGEEKSCLQTLLEQRSKECQALQAEQEALRLKLTDGEKMAASLMLRIDNSTQMTVQHGDTITNLQREKSVLINQHKHETRQLKAELVEQKSNLVRVERERQQLRASLADQSQRLQEEKREVIKQMELQRQQLFNLNEESEELRRLHSCRNDEHEGVVLKLQSQLSSTRRELEKIRRSQRTVEAAEGHGLQVALDMQKVITARREEADTLQTRIQHLEEEVEKLKQEKRHRNLETQCQLQELILAREEKRQLGSELKALRSDDHQLRERMSELQAIIHKMWESLANCQHFLQRREQEHLRLELQHASNLKEIHGQNLCAFPALSPSDPNSKTPSAQSAPPSFRSAYNTQIKGSSARELSSLVKEMRAVISDDHGPHTYKSAVGSSFDRRRRSAPERQPTATFEPHLLTSELDGETFNNAHGPFTSTPAVSAKGTAISQLLSLGRRSPVHTLLTSTPNS